MTTEPGTTATALRQKLARRARVATVMLLLMLPPVALLVVAATAMRDPVAAIVMWPAVLSLWLLYMWLRRERRRMVFPWAAHAFLNSGFTRIGVAHILITLAVGALATNTGQNHLFALFGALLSLILVSGVLAQRNLRRLSFSRLLPEEIYAGTPTPIVVEAVNDGTLLPAISLWVSEGWPVDLDPPEEGLPSVYVLRVDPRERVRLRYEITFPRRGVFRFQGFTLLTRFPFSMFSRYRHVRQEQEVLVLPRLRTLREAMRPMGMTVDAMSLHTLTMGRGTGDFRSLRDYAPGRDDVRWIHWPTSARRGGRRDDGAIEPTVREYERETEGPRWVVLECGVADATLEAAIELAAAFILDASSRNVPFTLVVPPDVCVGPPLRSHANRLRCFEALARLRGRDTDRPAARDAYDVTLSDLASARLTPGSSVVALETDRDHRFADWLLEQVPRHCTLERIAVAPWVSGKGRKRAADAVAATTVEEGLVSASATPEELYSSQDDADKPSVRTAGVTESGRIKVARSSGTATEEEAPR